MILEEVGRNPPDVTLDHIVKDLLSFFNGFEYLHEAKRMIEKKCDIKKEPEHKCWSEDYIKQAWKETIKEDIKSSRRRHWARVIILQVVKSFACDTCKQNAAQKNRYATPDVQVCETTPNPEDRSSQSKTELETVGAAGGVEQHSGRNQPTCGYPRQTGSVNHVGLGKQFRARRQATGNRAHDGETVTLGSEENMNSVHKTFYIRIPLSVICHNEDVIGGLHPANVRSRYKLINGFPSDNYFKRKSYTMLFDNETNNAKWVYEILNSNTLENNSEMPEFGDGYDRGHLAAAANHRWCLEAHNDTYLFSNIIPQDSTLNRGMWRVLEERCRGMITDPQRRLQIHNVHVYTGPLYLRRVHNADVRVPNTSTMRSLGRKVIPTHLFKVIIVENVDGTVREPECYVIRNEEPHEGLHNYRLNIEDIETLSGLTFIEHRSNENEMNHPMVVTLQGTGGNEEPCRVDMFVRISS